jgi:hypothetical protein
MRQSLSLAQQKTPIPFSYQRILQKYQTNTHHYDNVYVKDLLSLFEGPAFVLAIMSQLNLGIRDHTASTCLILNSSVHATQLERGSRTRLRLTWVSLIIFAREDYPSLVLQQQRR